jgi:coiled-coil-helix-coiled-coil-helix domain-containing protein 3
MGSGQSKTRSVSVDNDTPAGIIDVSDDVVQRLKTNLSKGNKSARN